MAKKDANDDIKAMSFEQALAELETIVEGLESGDSKLDDAITSYERGAALKLHCETKLREAQEKVEKIKLAADGSVSAEATEIS